MMMFRLTRLDRAAAFATFAALAALAAAPAELHAQTAPAPEVLDACYVPSSGTVYRIKETDLKQECSKATHVQFSWTDGAGAFRQVMTVQSPYVQFNGTLSPGALPGAIATCPEGWLAIGGGYFVTNGEESYNVKFSGFLTNTQWRVFGTKVGDGLLELMVQVRCVR